MKIREIITLENSTKRSRKLFTLMLRIFSFILVLGPVATATTPLVPMSRMIPSLTVPSITVPACTPMMSPTITSPLLHPHPTSHGATTTIYRGFGPLRDHRSVPYPTPYLRYNSVPQNEVPGYQSPPGTISSQ